MARLRADGRARRGVTVSHPAPGEAIGLAVVRSAVHARARGPAGVTREGVPARRRLRAGLSPRTARCA